VLNVVNGSGLEAGAPLALHNDVAKISFTGSTATGKKMLQYSAQSNMKRVSLECGGKSPQVFLADLEDLDRAVTYAINGIFLTAGESCSAGSRLLVDKRIAGDFAARFIELGRNAYRAGDPLDPETNLGPLVSAGQHARSSATSRRVATKARSSSSAATYRRSGYYVNTALFTHVRNDMRIAQEEIFGPVAALIEFDGLDEQLRIAKRHDLRARRLVWTRDLRAAHLAVRGLEAGFIYVNCYDHGDPTHHSSATRVRPGRRQVPRGTPELHADQVRVDPSLVADMRPSRPTRPPRASAARSRDAAVRRAAR
jgi:gamma-glutamyl-gamma-aminobutyraldehyde dehydrogenase